MWTVRFCCTRLNYDRTLGVLPLETITTVDHGGKARKLLVFDLITNHQQDYYSVPGSKLFQCLFGGVLCVV